MLLTPVFIDCKNLRFERQKINNNQQELKRLLEELFRPLKF